MAKIPSSSEKKRRRRAKARAKANKIAEAERTENFNSSRPGLDDLSAEFEDSDLFPETPAGPAQLRLRFQRRLFPEDEVPEQSELSFWAVSPAPDEPPHPLAPGSVPDSEEELVLVDSEAEEEDAVMAQVEIPPAEVSVRLQIEDDLAQFKAHMDKVPPNTRQAGINSQFVETELKKLQVTTYGRIARLPAAARDANKLDAKAEMLEADAELLASHETEDKKLSLVDLIHHIPGEGNPADMPTRAETEWSDLEPGKVWQNGPSYLLSPRASWPMTREGNFISKLPPEEKAKRFTEHGDVDSNTVMINKIKAGTAPPPLSKVLEVLHYSDKWLLVRNILARVVRMWRYENRSQAYADLKLEDIKVAKWLAALASQVELWHDMQVWESQVPYKKWRIEHRNVKVDDVVLLTYCSKVSAPTYRYGRVQQVHPDKHGVVRNVTVSTKSRRAREKPRELISTKLEHQMVPVQRLVMLLPVEEQSALPPASESLHICEEDFRVPAADLSSHRGASPSQPTLPAHGPTDSSHRGAPPSQPSPPAPGPTDSPDADLQCARLINSITCFPAHSGDYICSECVDRVRQSEMTVNYQGSDSN